MKQYVCKLTYFFSGSQVSEIKNFIAKNREEVEGFLSRKEDWISETTPFYSRFSFTYEILDEDEYYG